MNAHDESPLGGSLPSASRAPMEPNRRGGATFIRTGLILVSLVGLFISGVLTVMSLPAASGSETLSSVFCAPSSRVNCDYVLASRWARIGIPPMTAPVSVLGAAYYLAMMTWYLLVGVSNRAGRRWHWIPLGMSASALCGSIWFLYIMAVKLPVWCSWCLAGHAANTLLFLLVLAAGRIGRDAPGPARPSAARAGATLAIGLCAMVIAALGGLALMHQANSIRFHREWLRVTNDADYIAWRYRREAPHDIPVQADDFSIGGADAADTVVVFSDFECAGCAEFHRNAPGLVRSFPTVRCVFKHFPMCRACNKSLKQDMHMFACEAADAATAFDSLATDAAARTRFHDALFENREDFAERPYATIGRSCGITDVAAFEAIRKSKAVRARVASDVELGISLGIEGTPAVFLNGRRLKNWRIVSSDGRSRPDPAATLKLWTELLAKPSER